MIDKLSEDLRREILHKLSIKTIGQCICVSPSWRSQIKQLDFISSNNHFLRFRTSPDQFSLHSDNDKFDPYKHLNLPFKDENRNFRDCGTCNGLICLVKEEDSAIVLWNPTIKKTITLPKPNLTGSPRKVFCGFGFDSLTKDYKLIRILSFEGVAAATKAEVFSLQRNSWEILDPESLTTIDTKCDVVQAGPQAFVNGVLHWIGLMRKKTNSSLFPCQIVGFHMHSEKFQEIRLPEGMDDRGQYEMTIFVYKKSSIGVCFHDFSTRKHMEIWVMKEYGYVKSWTMIGKLDWQSGQLPATFGFRNNGEVILEEYGNIRLVDVENNKRKFVERSVNTFSRCPASYYVESLVLLNNPNAVSTPLCQPMPTDANDDEPMDIDFNTTMGRLDFWLGLEWFLQDHLES